MERFNYSIPLAGGCGAINATGTITVTPNMTATAGSSTPTLCISTALTAITHTTTLATGITNDAVSGANGLPAGVSAHWTAAAGGTITITGTPTASGTFNYSIPLAGGCGAVNATGTITVTPNMTATAGSSTPTLCISTALTAITHTTTLATGITNDAVSGANGLPAGVSAHWTAAAGGTITITGTPTASGTFNYSIPLTGGCGTINATGTITVTAIMSVTAGSATPTLCISTALPAITHTTVGATGISNDAVSGANGLPAGVSAHWTAAAGGTITITGAPTASGIFNYTIPLTGGCGTVNATGTMTIVAVPVTPAIGGGGKTDMCHGTIGQFYSVPFTLGHTYNWTIAPAGATKVSGGGVNDNYIVFDFPAANIYTLSVQEFTTVPAVCGGIPQTLTINVFNDPVGHAGTDVTVCAGDPTTIGGAPSATGGSGNFAYLWTPSLGLNDNTLANPIATPATTRTYQLNVTDLTSGCIAAPVFVTVTITPNNTVTKTSAAGTDAQTICISTPLTNITYSTTGATGATVTGLPAGVTGLWAGSVVTISGTPTVSGSFPYTVTLTGGCGTVTTTGTVTVTPNNTVTLVSPAGTDAQTLCISTPVTNITYSTTGATGATVTGLPAGVTGVWAGSVVTISGTPTVSGSFPYTVTLTGGCGTVTKTGTVTVTPNNTVSLTSAVGTDAQTLCISTPITNITYATTGATNATVSGLPTGVTGAWAANVVTISGTPTASGNFPYTVTLIGGCGAITTTGTVTVTPTNTVSLTSAAGTDAQTKCISTPVTNITYSTTGATGAAVTGLPAGVTGVWAGSVVTISGTPTASGSFPYTVTLIGGCGTVTTTGTVTVTPNNTVSLTSAVGTDAQTLCISTPITNITYATTGATNATVSGLPAGVTGAWAANVVTISGTPTASGNFPYTVTLIGGCGTITATGTVTVTPNNTVTKTSAAGTDAQTICISTPLTNITYSTTGATGATVTGLPAGVTGLWAGSVVTISGTPTVSGSFPYTVTLTGGCGTVTTTGTVTVTPNNTVTLVSPAGTDAQTLCISTPVTNITYSTTGATGATVTGLPAGVTGVWAGSVVTISGTPTVSGSFPYTVTLTGGCGTVTKTGTVTVTPNNTVSLTSAVGTDAQTLCISTPITNITYATTGATNATVSGLPTGVTGAWAANVVTISGTPTASGNFPYTVTLIGGCGAITTTGTVTVTPTNTVSLTSAAGTDAQTKCISTPVTNITYSTTGATGAAVTGLPAGSNRSMGRQCSNNQWYPDSIGQLPIYCDIDRRLRDSNNNRNCYSNT